MGLLPFVFDTKKVEKELREKSSLTQICAINGHVSSGKGAIIGRTDGIRVYDTCKRCHLLYSRSPTEDEMKIYKEIMKTEFVV